MLGWSRSLARLLVALALTSCAGDDAGPSDDASVSGYGVNESAITAGSVLSANGSYGASCAGRSGSWSVALSQGAALDHGALTVAAGNSACTLTLTALRTGAGASNLYTASSGIALAAAYPTTSKLFSSSGASFYGNGKLSATGFASDFTVNVLHSADPSLTSGSKQALYPYYVTVQNTSGLLSYWRLAESGVVVSDSFDYSGSAGVKLENRSGAVGASWSRHVDAASGEYAFVSSAGRIYTDEDAALFYYASGSPSSSNYSVESTIRALTLIDDDRSAMLGRVSTSAGSYYVAGYERVDEVGSWVLRRGGTLLASAVQAISTSTDYRATLEMRGSRLRLLVNGSQVLSHTDTSPLSSVGKAGLAVGKSGVTTNPGASAGLHIDDLTATPLADDAIGSNDGVYVRGVSLGAAGALTGASNPTNSSVTFDGTDDFIEVDNGLSDNFSIELWFKSSQGIGTGAQWYEGAALMDGEVAGAANDFGVSLRADGKVSAGVGNPDTTIVSTTGGYNNGSWHHVVFTRTKATGAVALYIDGQAKGSATGGTQSLNAAARLAIGRLQTGGNYFAGSIDEVAVYSSVMSAATALQHYQAGRP